MIDAQAFRTNHLVYGLTDEQLACIAAFATEQHFAEGEVLCRQGERGDELFILLEGRLRVQLQDGDELAELGPGSVVGEMGLIEPRPRSATVVAIEPSLVAAVSKSELRQELITDGNLGFLVLCNINRVLGDRLRQADDRLGTLMGTAVQA